MSDWNDAIEAAAKLTSKAAKESYGPAQAGLRMLSEDIRALKRPEANPSQCEFPHAKSD